MSHSEHEKVHPVKATGRRVSSVAALLKQEGVSKEIQDNIAALDKETCITRRLASMRAATGLTQEQLAEKIGVSQSCVSKWESGRDEDLEIKTIRAYTEATGQRIGIVIGKPVGHAEAIKMHLAGIQHRLMALAALAHENQELQESIASFFGETCFNTGMVLARCQRQMPVGTDVEVRVLFEGCATPSLPAVTEICGKAAGLVPA